jgi:nucleoside-diphosphate-sugar epimerase
MRAFVTGGTGFIGSHLIDYLLENKGAEVYALVRDLTNLKWLTGLDVHLLKGDLFTLPSLPSDIDYIFHIAGITKARKLADYYTVNQHGTASLFQALQRQRISPQKIICLSSIAASGPSKDKIPLKENDEPHPIHPYGESKLLGEKEALKSKNDFSLIIIRVGAVYGPRDKDFLSYFKIIKKGILPSLVSKQRWLSMCYIKDLVHAFDLCLQKDLETGEIFNIADPQPYNWNELGREAGKILGKKLFSVKIPLFLLYPVAIISEGISNLTRKTTVFDRRRLKEMKQLGWIADTRKAEDLLDFSAHYSLQEGLQKSLDWYIDQGWL